MNDPHDPELPSEPHDENPSEQSLIEEAVRDEVRRLAVPQVQHALGVQFAMGPPPDAFLEKLQPEHISRILD